MNSFERIRQFTEEKNICLVFVNIKAKFKKQFERSNFTWDKINFFGDLDHGIEWCENLILKSEETLSTSQRDRLFESTFDDMDKALEQLDNFEQLLNIMAPYLKPIHIQKGDFLFQQGEPVSGFYFIESGQISILLNQETNHPTRLREMGCGSIIGEWGDGERNSSTTSVMIQKSGQIFYLSNGRLEMMEKNDSELAFWFYKYMTQTLSERLKKSNNMILNML